MAVANAAENEIAATRVFDAPRELVWRMWTDPRYGFTNTIDEMDVRPGGVWRLVMHDPDAVAELADLGDKTEVSMRMRDKAAADQTLGRLATMLSRSLVMTRTFDAPRALVFRAWTDPAHVQQWWGPRGFTNPRCDWDARAGGAIHVDMRGPDGTVYPMPGRFHEVVEPERLVFSSSAVDGALEMLTTVTFAEEGDKTRMTLEAIVVKSTPEAAFALAGMRERWTQSLERLAAEVDETFVVSRTFDAPRELVWKAWTETERLMQWFGPKGFKMFHAKNDLRPGGTFVHAWRSPDGSEIWAKWTYREIAPPERIVLIQSFSDAEGNVVRYPMPPTLSTLTLTEHGGQTTVTLEKRLVGASEEDRNTFIAGKSNMAGGWSATFDQLAEHLARS